MTASTSANSQHSMPTAPATEWSEAATEMTAEMTATERFILEMLERLDSAEAKAEHLERALQHSRDFGAAVAKWLSGTAPGRLREDDRKVRRGRTAES